MAASNPHAFMRISSARDLSDWRVQNAQRQGMGGRPCAAVGAARSAAPKFSQWSCDDAQA
jgi:hypothetical protein